MKIDNMINVLINQIVCFDINKVNQSILPDGGPMAKLERRLTTNQEIAGSSPARLARFGANPDVLLYFIYIMEHFFTFFLEMGIVCELRDARVADSKTCFTPCPVFAEHSI